MKRFFVVVASTIFAGLTSSCDVGGELVCEGPPMVCNGRGEIVIPFSQSGPSLNSSFQPASVVLDFSGSNVGIPQAGHVVFTALDSSGTPISLTSAPYTQLAGVGYLDNPSAVSGWLQGVSGPIESLEAEIAAPVAQVEGVNTFSLVIEHANTNVATVADTWYRTGICNTGPLLSETACIE
ncbi:MAG: hypothetical protein RIA71_12795 [Oceanicaulis sp.]